VTRFLKLAAVAFTAAALGVGNASAATKPKAPKAPKPINPTTGVVLVTTNLAYEGAQAAGTGIVLTSTGEVLTNNHVIRGATTINVIIPATRKTYTADVVGYDIADDIALIKMEGASNLATATRADSSKLKLGQFTRAVGNANGGGKLVITTGTITGLQQSITVQNDDGETAQLTGLIRTSARLVPGDSGGPLLDAQGRVIGVDSAGSASYATQVSDGYAVPINKAYGLVKLMRAGAATALVHIGKTAFLGITAQAVPGGITVGSVVPGGAAEVAGIVPKDVITSIDGRATATLADVRAALFPHHPGDAIVVGYIDVVTGQPATASLTLGEGPPQ
jgi:S1-C subfamily serine protease